MSTAQRIYELVKTLPEAQANEVLDFVEFILTKYQQAVIVPSKPQLLPLPVLEGVVPQGWKDAIYE
jgi:hypothetical protein